jgi:hypothetical protein
MDSPTGCAVTTPAVTGPTSPRTSTQASTEPVFSSGTASIYNTYSKLYISVLIDI